MAMRTAITATIKAGHIEADWSLAGFYEVSAGRGVEVGF